MCTFERQPGVLYVAKLKLKRPAPFLVGRDELGNGRVNTFKPEFPIPS